MSKLEAGKQIREGLLIVVSILLAFGIDAAWDEGRDRRDERETLEALADDFEQNRVEAEDVIRSHGAARGLVVAGSQRTRGATLGLSGDSVAVTLAAMASPRTFDPVRSTLDALLSSGRLELLRDVELRRALVTFANLMDDSVGDELYLTEGALRVWDRLILHGGPWQSPNLSLACSEMPGFPQCAIDSSEWSHFPAADGATLQDVLDDGVTMGFVRQYQVSSSHYIGEIRRLRAQVGIILSLLGGETG